MKLSANGRYVVFEDDGDIFVLGDTNGRSDTFLRHLVAGTAERVSFAFQR